MYRTWQTLQESKLRYEVLEYDRCGNVYSVAEARTDASARNKIKKIQAQNERLGITSCYYEIFDREERTSYEPSIT